MCARKQMSFTSLVILVEIITAKQYDLCDVIDTFTHVLIFDLGKLSSSKVVEKMKSIIVSKLLIAYFLKRFAPLRTK